MRPGLQRGFSLIFVVTMLAVLSFAAALLLSRSTGSGTSAGGATRAAGSNNVAYAGATLAARTVEALVYANPAASLDLTKINALGKLSQNDPLCSDGTDCSKYVLLNNGLGVGTQGATVRMAATCNPGGCGIDPSLLTNFQVRISGTLRNQPTALLEVFLEANDD